MNFWDKWTEKTPQPQCLELAVMAAMSWKRQGYLVQLRSGQTEAGNHMQCEVLINGRWEVMEADGSCWVGKAKYQFTDFEKVWTLPEFLGKEIENV